MMRHNPTRAFGNYKNSYSATLFSFRSQGYYKFRDVVKALEKDNIMVMTDVQWLCFLLFPVGLVIFLTDLWTAKATFALDDRIDMTLENIENLKQLEKEL